MSASPQVQPEVLGNSETVQDEQSREAHRMETIGRLVSGVAHDFNNLLTGIVLCADLLLAGLGPESRLRRYAEEIRNAGAQGATLIQQLMAVARQQPAGAHLLSWDELVSGMRTLLTRLIGENIELVVDVSSDRGLVKIDRSQAQQIILNLVLNARDAMPDGGQIRLSTRSCQESNLVSTNWGGSPWIEFTVSDTGCGMSAETRAHLFEPFFTTKKPGKGNGLGLATVHSIVRQHGGAIDVESEPSRGTRIVVRMPRFEVAPQEPQDPMERQESKSA
jgi:two-component system, cell cycle sensor histidine kinase and response regulator CckA